MDGPGAYRSVINSLRRFQLVAQVPRILKFPIHKFAIRRLLTAGVKPPHPGRQASSRPTPRPKGAWTCGPICWTFLHHWFNCLAEVTATLTCCRCKKLGLLQTCDIWRGYDFTVGGWAEFKAGAAFDIKVRKNDNFLADHQARMGVPKDGRYDLLAQTKEALRLLGTTPGPLCDGRFDHPYPAAIAPRSSLAASRRAPSSTSRGRQRPPRSPPSLSRASPTSASTPRASPASRPARAGSPRRSKRASLKPSSGCRADTRRMSPHAVTSL